MGAGRFKKLVRVICIILRAFSIPDTPTTSLDLRDHLAYYVDANRYFQSGLFKTISEIQRPRRTKVHRSLHELTHSDTQQKIADRIHQRLHVTGSSSPLNECHFPTPLQSLQLSHYTQEVLRSSPWTRIPEQLEQVCKELKCCEAFSDYPPQVQKSLCRVGWYLRIGPGRVIVKEDHHADCFYFIISGNIAVTKRSEDYSSDNMEKAVDTLRPGDSFGDTDIISDRRRTATYSAKEQVELFVISKSDYLDLSLRQAKQSYQDTKHFSFCRSISVLKYWPLHLLESQTEHCAVLYFKPNDIVVKDSRKCNWIYVVMSGSCRVVKRFVDTGSQLKTPRKYRTFPEETQQMPSLVTTVCKAETAATKFAGHQEAESSDVRKVRRSLPFIERPVSRPKQFLVQLQLLQPKDVFGLSSILVVDEPSVTLVSNGAELVKISKSFIQEHMTESIRSKLRKQVINFPSQEAMLKRIREHHAWSLYKQTVVTQSHNPI